MSAPSADSVERMVISFGKVHYDLEEERRQIPPEAAKRVAIVRIEELYPWPEKELQKIVQQYPKLLIML